MTDTPMKLVVDLSKPEGERQSYVPLTAEELADFEANNARWEAELAARDAEAEALAALKASARQKLIAGQPLTAEEAATIVL